MPIKIKNALISTSDICKVGCKFCFRADWGRNSLSKKQLTRVLSRIKELGVETVCFTGGEPTDHPDFIDFCKISLQFGVYPSVITSARTSEQIKQLKSASRFLSHITISADSAEIRQNFDSNRTLASAGLILQEIKGPSKSIHLIVSKITNPDISDILLYCVPNDIMLEISPFFESSLKSNNILDVLLKFQDELKKIENLVTLSKKLYNLSFNTKMLINTQTCVKQQFYISANGELRFCPYSNSSVDLTISRADIYTKIMQIRDDPTPKNMFCSFVCTS